MNSGASRERTASVGRQHGELGLLIKIFYKSACAVHMRDNRPEWGGGVGRILKQLPLWKKTNNLKLTPRATWWKNMRHLTFTLKDKVKPVVFAAVEENLVCVLMHIFCVYLYSRQEIGKEKTIQHCGWKTMPWMRGWRPLCEDLVSFQSWYPTLHHVMEGDTYCISTG